MKELETECLVIGSGAGGSTIADYLLDHGFEVLMIEEGQFDAENSPPNATDSMLQNWRGGGLTPAFGSPNITYAEGRCVGGGTEINSGIIQKAPTQVLSEWGEKIPADKSFYEHGIYEAYDWVDSILSPSELDSRFDKHSQLLRLAGERQGWRVESLPRAIKGCICNQPLCLCGGRRSMTKTLLPKLIDNQSFKLISNARVDRCIFEKNRVSKVMAKDFSTEEVEVLSIRPRNVFLCAGAIQTPNLLMRSGYRVPGLGKFQLHPTIKVLASFEEPVLASQQRLPNVAITEFMPDLRFGGSVLTPGVFGMALAENWRERQHLRDQLDFLASYYVMVRPESWGNIRGSRFTQGPLVTYRLNRNDFSLITDGLRKISHALFDVGAGEVHPSIKGLSGWKSSNEVDTYLDSKAFKERALNLMSIHLFSSCSPLINKDEFLQGGQLKSLSNLVVADGSILPSAPGVNPQATIMALARRSAGLFCDRER